MRLTWSERALHDLGGIAGRAIVQARHIQQSVEALVVSPFPGMYRRVAERPNEHVLSVRPHVVFYVIDGDTLTVLRITDGRQRKHPW